MRIYFRKDEKIIKIQNKWAINNKKNIKPVRYSPKYIK